MISMQELVSAKSALGDGSFVLVCATPPADQSVVKWAEHMDKTCACIGVVIGGRHSASAVVFVLGTDIKMAVYADSWLTVVPQATIAKETRDNLIRCRRHARQAHVLGAPHCRVQVTPLDHASALGRQVTPFGVGLTGATPVLHRVPERTTRGSETRHVTLRGMARQTLHYGTW